MTTPRFRTVVLLYNLKFQDSFLFPSKLKNTFGMVLLQRSHPSNSRMVHPHVQKVMQRWQETCMDNKEFLIKLKDKKKTPRRWLQGQHIWGNIEVMSECTRLAKIAKAWQKSKLVRVMKGNKKGFYRPTNKKMNSGPSAEKGREHGDNEHGKRLRYSMSSSPQSSPISITFRNPRSLRLVGKSELRKTYPCWERITLEKLGVQIHGS